jgi:threonine dehydrogenase-like Zn-dependent dehydrogenase
LEPLVMELRRAHLAYGLPLMVTETAVEGGADKQCAWVDELVEGLRGLRKEGLPIVGLTWWPLMDFVDWSWASGGSVVEEFYRRDGEGQRPHAIAPLGVPGGPVAPFLRRMGLYRLEPDAEGNLERRPTRVLARFRTRAVPPAARPVLDGGSPTNNQGAIMPGSLAAAPRFLGDGKIVFEELPVPSPGPGQLLLRVRANAICGSDRAQYFEGSAVTPGHEAAGVVAAAGPGTAVAEGTPGVVFLMDYCGRCRSCRLGFTNQCLAKRADMGFTHDGGYGPYEVVHESNFFAVDAGTDLVEATMLLDVMGTSSHALARASLVRPDIESAYIAGAGPIGLGLLVMCKLTFGSDFPVYVSDISPWRLNYAESFGARAVDASQPEALAALEPSDVAFDSTGKSAARKGALAALSKRGVLVCVGHGETLDLAVSGELIAPERAVLGSEYFRYEEMARNFELFRDNRELIGRVITHRFDVAQITEAFETFLSGESGKVVVTQELGT